MGNEKYLIVYPYNNEEIRIVIETQYTCGNLSKVLVAGNNVNGELSSENICKCISDEMEICERFIAGEKYQKPQQRIFGLFTVYCGSLISLEKVHVNYDRDEIWYMSTGMMMPSCPLNEAIDSVKNGIVYWKRWIDKRHPLREDGDWTCDELSSEELAERTEAEKRNTKNRMLYPELFPDAVCPVFLESYSAEKVAGLLEAISGDMAAGRSGGKQKSHKIPRPGEKHQS